VARRFSRSRRGIRRKRSVAWIPGVTGYDIAAFQTSRLIPLSQVAAGLYPNVFGAAIGLTTNTDLSLHGGEDAVMTRIVGRLGFTTGRVNAGAGVAATTYLLRCVVAQTDNTDTGSVMPFEYLSSNGMGNDDIMWFRDIIVPGTSVLEQTGATPPGGTQTDYELDVDIGVKRKIESNRQLVLWFQTVFDAGTFVAADFRLYGGLRMLMMRPV